jgi:hypothetical protein
LWGALGEDEARRCRDARRNIEGHPLRLRNLRDYEEDQGEGGDFQQHQCGPKENHKNQTGQYAVWMLAKCLGDLCSLTQPHFKKQGDRGRQTEDDAGDQIPNAEET